MSKNKKCLFNYFLKHLIGQLNFGDSGYRAGHDNSEVFIDGNMDLTARHMDGNGGIAKSKFFCHRRGRAAAAARSQGVARSPLPDLDPDVMSIQDF